MSEPTLDLGALYRTHHHLLVRRALAILHHREDAEDAAASVWVKLSKGSTWSGDCAIGTWLYFMVSCAALDLRRNAATRVKGWSPLIEAERILDQQPSAFEVVAGRERLASILPKLRGLSPEERDVLLRTARGDTRSTTARSLKIPTSTVKTRLTRARRRLR